MKTISQLRASRISAEISQIKLAARAGIDHNRISRFECGYLQPNDEELSRIDKALESLIEERRRLAKLAADAGLPFSSVGLQL